MAEKRHVCPWWLGYLLASPLRRWIQKPERILGPYIKEGMQVLDVGSAMGFFSLPLARMVGTMGRVICIDLQEKMIRSLKRRAAKAGLSQRIETRVCSTDSLPLEDFSEKIDFSLVFAVLHEVPDQERLLKEVYRALKNGGCLLLAEPSGHVKKESLDKSIELAQRCGFEPLDRPLIPRSHSVLLGKKYQPSQLA